MVGTSHDTNGNTRHSDGRPQFGAAGSTHRSSAPEQDPSKPTNPLEPLLEQIAVVREFALHYVEAQTDAAKAAVRRTLLKAAAALIGAIVAVTFVIVCTIMLAEGLAELISIAAGDRAWVGNLALGGGVLLMLAVAIIIFIARQLRAAREQTIRKYENRHLAQRAKFGADVTQQAAT
jgi:hypothetical protein